MTSRASGGRAVALALIVTVTGCGASHTPDGDAAVVPIADASVRTDARVLGRDAGATLRDAGTTTPVVDCVARPPVFPTFDRACMTNADCDLGAHQTDCCGSILHTGFAAHERARFDAAEASCRPAYPDCECVGSVRADDGTTPASGTAPYVTCMSNECVSSFFLGG